MTIATITEAQRQSLNSAVSAVDLFMQQVTQNGAAPSAAVTAAFLPLVNALTAALAVAGHSGTTATQFILNSGVKVNAVAVTGTGNFATPTIVAGAITGIVLSAS